MSYHEDMQDDLKFEQLIKDFNEPERFLARQLREVQKECSSRRYCNPVAFSRKQIVIGLGSVSGVSAIVATIFEIIARLTSG